MLVLSVTVKQNLPHTIRIWKVLNYKYAKQNYNLTSRDRRYEEKNVKPTLIESFDIIAN